MRSGLARRSLPNCLSRFAPMNARTSISSSAQRPSAASLRCSETRLPSPGRRTVSPLKARANTNSDADGRPGQLRACFRNIREVSPEGATAGVAPAGRLSFVSRLRWSSESAAGSTLLRCNESEFFQTRLDRAERASVLMRDCDRRIAALECGDELAFFLCGPCLPDIVGLSIGVRP